VLCTPLHSDHVGWNTMPRDGHWVPTCMAIRVIILRQTPTCNRSNSYRDIVLPVIEAGQAELIDGTHNIGDAMLIEPASGHTSGHIILKLDDRGEKAVLCGDAIHHPLQVYAPHWNSGFCELPEEARATRHRVLEHCAEYRALLFPIHFGASCVAAIASAGDSFSLRFVEAKDG
jgi:glyoxylase-like metal-dependent hydrolase (beta-lactamase superfamily II)